MEGPVLKTVITFDGSKAIKNNCRHIKGDYYEMNRQCYLMPDGKWHRINNGKITYNHRNNTWVFKNSHQLVSGVVDEQEGEPVIGDFTRSPNDLIVTLKNGSRTYMLDESLVRRLNLVENISDGGYVDRSIVTKIPPGKNYIGSKRIYSYPLKLDYNSEDSLGYNIALYNKHKVKGSLDFFTDEIDSIKWGVEMETWNGTVPYRHLPKVGLIPLLDGSLRQSNGETSYEYATIPLKGGQGLYTTKLACDLLTKYTSISKDCSVHLHISGFDRSKEFILSLYKTAKAVEEEIYSLFPKYYKDTSKFKGQGKSYCGPLPTLLRNDASDTDESFDYLYQWLSMGNPFEEFNNNNHPNDPGGHSKWYVSSRYVWLNLVPFIWGNRQTVEFRVHPPTTNAIKVISWIFICNAILKYANLYKNSWSSIKESLSLHEIFETVYDVKLVKYLNSYTKTLKRDRKIADSVKDFAGLKWCDEDSEFTFSGAHELTRYFEECQII